MKSLARLFIILFLISPSIAEGDPLALQKKYGSEMQLVRSIWLALIQYDAENDSFPDSLATLVTKNIVKAEALHIKLEDGGVQIPTYYPGHSSAEAPSTILLTYDLPDLDKRIVANLQGVIQIEEKPKKPNKAEMATPRKPSD